MLNHVCLRLQIQRGAIKETCSTSHAWGESCILKMSQTLGPLGHYREGCRWLLQEIHIKRRCKNKDDAQGIEESLQNLSCALWGWKTVSRVMKSISRPTRLYSMRYAWCQASLSGKCLEISWSQRMFPTTDLPVLHFFFDPFAIVGASIQFLLPCWCWLHTPVGPGVSLLMTFKDFRVPNTGWVMLGRQGRPCGARWRTGFGQSVPLTLGTAGKIEIVG